MCTILIFYIVILLFLIFGVCVPLGIPVCVISRVCIVDAPIGAHY